MLLNFLLVPKYRNYSQINCLCKISLSVLKMTKSGAAAAFVHSFRRLSSCGSVTENLYPFAPFTLISFLVLENSQVPCVINISAGAISPIFKKPSLKQSPHGRIRSWTSSPVGKIQQLAPVRDKRGPNPSGKMHIHRDWTKW